MVDVTARNTQLYDKTTNTYPVICMFFCIHAQYTLKLTAFNKEKCEDYRVVAKEAKDLYSTFGGFRLQGLNHHMPWKRASACFYIQSLESIITILIILTLLV